MKKKKPPKRWRVDQQDAAPPPIPDRIRVYADSVKYTGAPPVISPPLHGTQNPKGKRPAKAKQSQPGSQSRGLKSDPSTSAKPAIELEVRERDSQKHDESKSWASSIGLHLIGFILIALMLAPADYGGSEVHEITMRLGDGEAVGIHQGAEVDIEVVEPETTVENGEAAAAPATSGKSGGGSKGNGEEGPRGSFFGIDASGHEFVYILDMSGSMKGERFKAATEELVRSVDALTEAQKFYVILFSDKALQMFNETSSHPSAIAASNENKSKLRLWLSNAYKGGSTDPRDALRIGLAMNPSAIFMLSDGEFRDTRNIRGNMFEGQSDAYQIVSGALYKPPVHAIAYQDESSCHNMKKLSHISSGQYRFVGNQDNEIAERLMRAARDQLYDGDKKIGAQLLQRIVQEHGVTEIGWEARTRLVAMRAEVIGDLLKDNRADLAHQQFLSLVKVDPKGTVTSDIQQRLMSDLIQHADRASDTGESKSLMEVFSSITNQYGRKEIVDPILQPFVRRRFDEAIKMSRDGKKMEAVAQLAHITRNFPFVSFAKECEKMERVIAEDVLAGGEEYRRDFGNAAYAKQMSQLQKTTSVTNIRMRAGGRMGELAKGLNAARIAAGRRGDFEEEEKLKATIEKAFGSEQKMTSMAKSSQSLSLSASRLLQAAKKVEKSAGPQLARKYYQRVVTSCPGTLAAQKAAERLAELKPDVKASETLESMLEL